MGFAGLFTSDQCNSVFVTAKEGRTVSDFEGLFTQTDLRAPTRARARMLCCITTTPKERRQMNPIPQAVWLKVADRRKLRSWWAEVMFNLEDEDQAQAIQEAVNEELRAKGVPAMAILAYQTILPLMLEAQAISGFVADHPQYRDALPEVLTQHEAVALAMLEWRWMEETEIEALRQLLPETPEPVNSLWGPAIKRHVGKLEPTPTQPKPDSSGANPVDWHSASIWVLDRILGPRPTSTETGQPDALNSHPLNQAALQVLRKEGAEDKPDRAYLLQLAAWFLEDGKGNPADEDDDRRLMLANLLNRSRKDQLTATRIMEDLLTPDDVKMMPPAEVADAVAYQLSPD